MLVLSALFTAIAPTLSRLAGTEQVLDKYLLTEYVSELLKSQSNHTCALTTNVIVKQHFAFLLTTPPCIPISLRRRIPGDQPRDKFK